MTQTAEKLSTEIDPRAEIISRILTQSFTTPGQQWSPEATQDILSRPGVWADIHTSGCLIMLTAADEAEVLTIAVCPGARRKGMARELLRRAMNEARRQGVRRLFLEVAADNAAARALYWREDFHEVGRRTGYYKVDDKRIDALVLARDL
ncbi:MAG: GNAT family N-acetyltransferase [Pseudomonadota bacterium]